MPRVISYTRFSSKKQENGDSKERQDRKAFQWCLDNGYELDLNASIHDPGYSAYAGANVSKGALGVLQLAAINRKLEPDTILLIEAFDRLTRLPLPEAYELLLSLVNNGVTIVTLTDSKVWNKKTLGSLETFMLSLVSLYRGFQESEYKSGRLQSAFSAARQARSKSSFGSAPGWLSRQTKDAPWTIDIEKAAVVVRIFEMSAAGYGTKAIAKRANEEKWIVPTRLNRTDGRWHSSMPGIILRNRAVLGYHEHRIKTYEAKEKFGWKGEATGMIDHDYYPRIISDALWGKAQASVLTRKIDKRRDENYYNVFSGLMYCGHCGAPMQRKVELRGYSRGTLVCADKVSGMSECPSGAAVTVDRPLLNNIFSFRHEDNIGEEIAEQVAECEASMAVLKSQMVGITDSITKLGALDVLTDKLGELQFEYSIIEIARETAMESKDTLWWDFAVDDWGDKDMQIQEAIENLYVANNTARDYRAALHLRIARQVETIWVWNYEVAVVKFKQASELKVVPLDSKRLPSRANSLAKWHKPPEPKVLTPRPFLEAAQAGTLMPPVPRVAPKRFRAGDRNKTPMNDKVANLEDVSWEKPFG